MAEALSATSSTAVVRAAGGLLWRLGPTGCTEVVVVHRPRYGDWSLPKGKCDEGEAPEDCALREVEEETGFRCVLGPELPATTYVDRKGRPKEVRYWAMTLASGSFAPNDEVDEIRWLSTDDAGLLLTYPRDREFVAAFARRR